MLPNSAVWDDFFIVGQGRFYQDDQLLNICEQRGLIERKNK